jgi:hypothetical protein
MKNSEGILDPDKKPISSVRKYMVILPLSAITIFVGLPQQADAQIVVSQVLQETVGRVIRAIDLEVQRFQNQTIWLQDAQKTLENTLSKLKLSEIADWTQKQKDLYSSYFNELWQIKSAIATYERVYDITEKQTELVSNYNQAWGRLRQDKHFSAEELGYMGNVYSGLLQESIKNMDRLLVVVVPSKTQMSDAERLKLINEAADGVDRNYSDMQQFNNRNYMLSIQRAKDENEVLTLKKYYGID